MPALSKRESEGCVDLHPEDACRRDIANGQSLGITTPRGRARMKARLSDAVHRGSIRVGWCWGEVDPECNVNNLTDDDIRDPVTATPSKRSFICSIET
ncbi:MAG: hypothetical protein JW950_11150 [Deltaproteobacteria bacterium]|nr:hypothetical protein [Deltaproteobacteria bacterium]